mgnify:CR=1 FL=1
MELQIQDGQQQIFKLMQIKQTQYSKHKRIMMEIVGLMRKEKTGQLIVRDLIFHWDIDFDQ